MLASKFSFFNGSKTLASNSSPHSKPNRFTPTLKLQTDREVYRPGDSVFITIEISNQISTVDSVKEDSQSSFLIEKLGFEIVGIQKLDSQWFVTPKTIPGSKRRRGENVFLECSTTSMVSNQIISSGSSKTYVVRAVLPSVIPPSYKGATIRYMYYIRSSLAGSLLILENGNSYHESSKDVVELEARIPLQIWVAQKNNGLLMEESLGDGIVPAATIQMDIYWKEMDGDSEWARANDLDDGAEEGYESSRDEISSVSSYYPTKETIHKTFGSSLSLQSSTARSFTRDTPFIEGGRTSFSSALALPRLSVAEVMYDSGEAVLSPSRQQKMLKFQSEDDSAAGPFASGSGSGSGEATTSEGLIRGRSYNIRMDDQVLLRFSPRNSDSTYYFSDMIGGTLTFFHEEGARRCLEVSITLETSETINRSFVHQSRRNSPTITKVLSDHYEVVADLIQTSFLFSIPMDGPMSFSTPHVSVQWVLRFEFFTTPKNVNWTRYDHPLLVDGRDKSEWVLPIVVHAPPPQAASHAGNNRSFSLDPLWVHN